MSANKIIPNEVLSVLSQSTVQGQIVLLPPTQLDRKLYTKVNDVLTALGGRWTTKLKGHLFSTDPQEALENALMTRSYERLQKPSHSGFFPTPANVVQQMLEVADVKPHHKVLEPSAGRGAIADEVSKIVGKENITCIEKRQDNAEILHSKGYDVRCMDFLDVQAEPLFARVVMNPPFEKQADIDHVQHAYKCLRPAGILVSIMSASILFSKTNKAIALRDFIEANGSIEELPENSFKASGTNVSTVMVTLIK